MVKNSLSLILVVVSYVLPLTTLNLMVYFEFLILLPICYLSINFVCKTIFFFFAILVLIDFLSRIYLHGRSFTNVWLKMESIHFLHYLLCAHPIPLLILPPKIISLYRLLLILLKFPFGITNLGMQVSNYFILLSNLLIMLLHSIRLMNVVLLVNLV